jgi:hypothetical protein
MKTEKLQLGVIVADLDVAIDRAEKLFGVGPFRKVTVPEAGVNAAMADWAGVELELIASATEETRAQHMKFLQGRGAKLAHIGAYVPDKDAALEHFRSFDVPVVYEDTGGDEIRTAMVDTRNDAGYLLELLERIK